MTEYWPGWRCGLRPISHKGNSVLSHSPDTLKSAEHLQGADKPDKPEVLVTRKKRFYIIAAALMALFLGALDALVMSAAMPTIVTDLGRLDLYSWVYSAYLLARAVSLPVFGKLSDIFKSRRLFVISICTFLVGSVFAGLSQSMTQLILSRVLQGIGAGGNFALVYIVLADVSSPENRGKALSVASFIWGLASVLGPTFGGFVVTYFSWRWIFFVNIPLGLFSLIGIGMYLVEVRDKKKAAAIDYFGVLTLTTTILSLLTVFLLAGRSYDWRSFEVLGLSAVTIISGIAFYLIEKKAREPILSPGFFRIRGFSVGNGAAFLASFVVFSQFAYSPLFIQGALNKSPLQMGFAMLSLSLGWSVGALICGQVIERIGEKPSAIFGAMCLAGGSAVMVTFSTATSLTAFSIVLGAVGIGMGFVSIATLLIVQDSLDAADLGISTASHQFSRTLGGTVGVGVTGSFVTMALTKIVDDLVHSGLKDLPPSLHEPIQRGFDSIFRPEIQALFTPDVQKALQDAVARGVLLVFWITLGISLLCLLLTAILPSSAVLREKKS